VELLAKKNGFVGSKGGEGRIRERKTNCCITLAGLMGTIKKGCPGEGGGETPTQKQ